MPFVMIWIFQMLVFFLLIIGIVFFFSKVAPKINKEQQRQQKSVEKSYQPIQTRREQQEDLKERLKRNQSTKSNQNRKNQRAQAERNQQKNETIASRRRRREVDAIGGVVKFESTKPKKKKKVHTSFNKKSLKQAMLYKEILDKPLSLREETTE